MENPDHKREAKDIEKSIKELKEELEQVQSDCNHSKIILKFAENGHTVMKHCAKCNKQIGHPNEKELRDNGFL